MKKSVWVFVVLLFLMPLSVNGIDYTIKTVPNVRLENGRNHVTNPDHIIDPNDVAAINIELNQLEDSLGIEVAIVALTSIGENDARSFATDLFQYWGLGKKGKDNGLLIQLITEPNQRSVVFETGYGLEGVLPDAICKRLQQRYMIPVMRKGDYSLGMLQGTKAVCQYLKASDYDRGIMLKQKKGKDDSLGLFGAFAVFALFIITVLISILKRSPRCPKCKKRKMKMINRQSLRTATEYQEGYDEVTYKCSNCGHIMTKKVRINRINNSNGGGFIGGFGGNSGSGGGFSGGSWGGGSSGGGGSISRF